MHSSQPSSVQRHSFFRSEPLAIGSVKALLALALATVALTREAGAISAQPAYVAHTASPGSFELVQGGKAATIYVDAKDWPGVIRAAGDLQADVKRVTGIAPAMAPDATALPANTVIIGTIGQSAIIDRLVSQGKIDVTPIKGKWESFFLQTVANPLPGVASALVIVGSDKRATIFGIYDLSEQIGVSPWYWWADVATTHQDALFVKRGKYQQGEPSVKYRGIFFNDENPDLDQWVRTTYGSHATGTGGTAANMNHEFYSHVFEVILRLKGNYLWPAMWNNAFALDDVDNPKTADYYGVVMGSSHQEPMDRAQKEWDWVVKPQGYGNWDYGTAADEMNRWWREGVAARKDYESVYTMGLRGENDSAMTGQGPALLEQIVAAQRKILTDVVNPDITKVPQLWCLYKEVQGYYENGLRVPDDITLLWAEDNWGDVRRVPTAEERKRPGGAGIYYHFDYHGGPRSYQWQNTSPIAKIWDQMSLAQQYGADRVWIVNVGHFKGYEFPTEYFLSLGWDAKQWTNENLNAYTKLWAEREFGPKFSGAIAEIIEKYSKYNGRRKPELLAPDTYSLTNYHEADRVLADFEAITQQAEAILPQLPKEKQDAFYELVLFPTKASAQVNEMNVAAGRNALYIRQGRASANDWAEQTTKWFQADADLTTYYHTVLAGGKWNHINDQVHIGYTTWSEPKVNNVSTNLMPRVQQITPGATPSMGVAVDGSESAWPGNAGDPDPALPKFDALNRQHHDIEVFNRGTGPFQFTAVASDPWIVLGASGGQVEKDAKLDVSVDWSKAPKGDASGTVKVSRVNGGSVTVKVAAFNPTQVTRESLQGFVEGEGYVSIEAEHYSGKTGTDTLNWSRVEDYGRTLSGMRSMSPVDVTVEKPGPGTPCLEYRMYLFSAGQFPTWLVLSPSLNTSPDRGLRIAVSCDDQAPQMLTFVPQGYSAQNGNGDWETADKDNARIVGATASIAAAGYHTLKVWMVDPAVVVTKIVVNTGGLKSSYLGPPESYRGGAPKLAMTQN